MGRKEEFFELRRLVIEILGIVKGEFQVREILAKRIDTLEEKERELLDRLMARNYGEFILGQNVENEERIETTNFPEDTLEENAGGMIRVED